MREFIEPTAEEGEPKRAPITDRVKRGVWLLASMAIAFVPALGVMLGVAHIAGPHVGEPFVPLAGAVGFVTLLVVDYYVWRWGIERFDIVYPVEFRRERWKEERETDG